MAFHSLHSRITLSPPPPLTHFSLNLHVPKALPFHNPPWLSLPSFLRVLHHRKQQRRRPDPPATPRRLPPAQPVPPPPLRRVRGRREAPPGFSAQIGPGHPGFRECRCCREVRSGYVHGCFENCDNFARGGDAVEIGWWVELVCDFECTGLPTCHSGW